MLAPCKAVPHLADEADLLPEPPQGQHPDVNAVDQNLRHHDALSELWGTCQHSARPGLPDSCSSPGQVLLDCLQMLVHNAQWLIGIN